MNNIKFFGREPAALVGTIQAVLALLISFNLLDFIGLDTDQDLAVVIGVVGAFSALYLAYVTSETLLAPIIEVIKAGLALGAIYGLSISTEQTGLLIAATTAILAGYQRDRVSPLDEPTFGTASTDETEYEEFDSNAGETVDPADYDATDYDLPIETIHGGVGTSNPSSDEDDDSSRGHLF